MKKHGVGGGVPSRVYQQFPFRNSRITRPVCPHVGLFLRSSPSPTPYPLFSQTLASSFALSCTLLHLAKTQLIYFQTLPHSLRKRPGYSRNLRQGSGILRTKRKQTRTAQQCWFLGAAASPSAVTSRPWPGQFSQSGLTSLHP